jgi:hypothetical protein
MENAGNFIDSLRKEPEFQGGEEGAMIEGDIQVTQGQVSLVPCGPGPVEENLG